MSDTTTPSAAEVMWTSLPCLSADNPGHPVGCRTWTRWDGARSEYGERPPNEHTPDDMLAWLRKRGFHVIVHAWVKWPVHVRLQTGETAEESSYGGPTLHAALEQAVIAVGRAE